VTAVFSSPGVERAMGPRWHVPPPDFDAVGQDYRPLPPLSDCSCPPPSFQYLVPPLIVTLQHCTLYNAFTGLNLIFIAGHYASTVHAVVVRLSVRLSACLSHDSIVSK